MSRISAALFAMMALLAGSPALAGGERLEVFYLHAPDCPYCAHWESQSRAALLASPEGKAVHYAEIRGETLRRPIEARHYPREFQWVYEQIGPSRGVPRFVLAIDGKVVLTAFGTGGYAREFLPMLKQAVHRRQEAK